MSARPTRTRTIAAIQKKAPKQKQPALNKKLTGAMKGINAAVEGEWLPSPNVGLLVRVRAVEGLPVAAVQDNPIRPIKGGLKGLLIINY